MNKTEIEWVKNPDGTQGYSWNPITGCLKGCEYCYARKLANGRLKAKYLANKNIIPPYKDIEGFTHTPTAFVDIMPFYPRSWFDRREKLLENVKPKGVFVCDMSDLFGIGIPESWTECVLETIKVCPEHRFYLLTKQSQNLIKWSPFPENCWVGVSATNTETFMRACSDLEGIRAKIKFLSIEPLLDWSFNWSPSYLSNSLRRANIRWLIIGQQTPIKKTTTPKIEWIKEIIETADKAGTLVFLKNKLRELLCRGATPWAWQPNAGMLRQEFP